MGFSLDNLHGGALLERVQREVSEIVRNLTDPNTRREEKRELTIVLTFDPKVAEDRSFVGIHAKLKKKLAPLKPISTIAVFEGRGEQMTLVEVPGTSGKEDPRQKNLAPVTPIRPQETKAE